MKRLSNDHEDRPNQQKSCHKLCDEIEWKLKEIELKLIQEHDQNCVMKKKERI